MKAIILAAGYGNRMRPLTDTTHKTLLFVKHKTILQGIIDSLLYYDISEIVIVTGYLADSVEHYLVSKYPGTNFRFVHNPRYRETNNIYSLSLAINAMDIDDDIILIESDLIYEPSVIRKLIDSKYDNVALVDKFRSGMDGTVVTISNHVVTNIIPPHLQDSNFDFSDKYKTLNIYKFSKQFCLTTFKQLLTYYAKAIDDNCYYELILGVLIYMQRETIYAEIIENEEWSEVDDPNDLNVAEFVFNKEKRLEILETGFGGYWNYNVVDFCFIRNMYFPNSAILSEMKNNLASLVGNYGSRQSVLNQKLAYFLLYKKDNLNLLNGASQIYPVLQTLFANCRVLIPSPTFGEYPRIFLNSECYFDQVGIECQEIEDKAATCQVVVIVNPNNPTGSLIQTEWIYRFAEENPSKTFIIDESFVDFGGCGSIIDLLERHPLDNVIVIKSLSKALGTPGLRLGFVYSSNQQFNHAVYNALPIWNSNSFAEYFLEIILKHRRSLDISYKNTIRDRDSFTAMLSELDFIKKVYPSGANFLLVEFKKKRNELEFLTRLLLAKHSIYLKDVSNKFNNDRYYLRIAVRLPNENETLVKNLAQIFDSYYNGKWKLIWENRNLNGIETPTQLNDTLEKLVHVDGFDKGNGNIKPDSWKQYIEFLTDKMGIRDGDSIFEVGCGCGAFLYLFHHSGHRVGGIDYSEPMINKARSIMANADFTVCDAINLDCNEKYDFIVANSVFFYFPDYEYSKEVLRKMINKSNKAVLVLDIPDLHQKEACENIRRGALPPGEYEKKYDGLHHLYFDKDWFHDFAKTNNCKVGMFGQIIANYGNGKFRFNCMIEKQRA
jgi:histidinol-phosphate/aromatic aminotransferase/cobyric acid decarboxylase-like protein/choline kinase/ubiquinone/menaquinone biosynthesis C-methylase UbiE